MKAYYSIVSIATKPQLDEKFNIGLLCVTPENAFFHFSDEKFSIVAKLLSSGGRKLAHSALKGMDEQLNSIPPVNKVNLFSEFKNENPNAVSSNYLSYLSRYNNNLVQFSAPISIDLEIDRAVFNALFQKLIYSDEIFGILEKSKIFSFSTVRNNFRKAASPYANTNFNVTQKVIKDLIAPVKVDAFGKNGSFVMGQSIDFNKSIFSLQSEITSFSYLTEHTYRLDKDSKSFVLGNEPSKKEKENHDMWRNVRNAGIIEFVPTDEAERIISYMKTKGVMPLEQ